MKKFDFGRINKQQVGLLVVSLIPFLLLIFATIIWLTNPVQAASDLGIDMKLLELNGQNAVFRDLTALFIANALFLLFGIISGNWRWYMATAIFFGAAFGLNFYSVSQLGTQANPSMAVELILFMFGLGLASWSKRLE